MEAESQRDENHRQCMRIETGLAHEVANQGGLLNECLAAIPADSKLAKRILYFREHRKPMPDDGDAFSAPIHELARRLQRACDNRPNLAPESTVTVGAVDLLLLLGHVLSVPSQPAPLGYVLVELDAINNLCGRLKALMDAGSADAKSLAADAALLLEARRG